MEVKKYKNIESISCLWNKLYQDGLDMSFYQSFDWNRAAEINFYKKAKNAHKKLVYYVFDNSLIAPIVVDNSKKRITLLGQEESSDYLSFIYRRFNEKLFRESILFIMKDFKLYEFILDKINQSNPMTIALKKESDIFNLTEINKECVYIKTNNEKKSFYDSLSKNSRQNYRTAKNRLEKEYHTYCIKTRTEILSDDKAKKLYALYKARRNDCDSRNIILKNIIKLIQTIIKYIFKKNEIDLLTWYSKKTEIFLSEIYIDGELAAFCEGNYNNRKNVISIARVATNAKFYHYSPGQILLIDTIEKIRNKVSYFDLTRGSEDYKFKLGGIRHFNKCFTISYKNEK